MASSYPTAVVKEEQWKTAIRMHNAYLHVCMSADDFSYFDALRKLHHKAPALMTHEFHKLLLPPTQRPSLTGLDAPVQITRSQAGDLQTIADSGTQKLQDTSGQIKNRIEADAQNAPTDKSKLPEWAQQMKDKNDADKKKLTDQMDQMTDDAIAKIETYPPEQQAPAANAWIVASNIITQVLGNIVNVFKTALDAVVNFVHDAIQKVEEAFNSAKNWCEGAVNDVALVSVWWWIWAAGRFNCRRFVIVALIIPTLLGEALMAWLPAKSKSGLLAEINLINTVGSALSLLYSWLTANYAGHSKEITMNAILLMSFCLGNIIGPGTFQASDAPQYIPAKMAIVITLAIAILITIGLVAMYHLENKSRDREGHQEMPEDYQFLDLTDKEDGNFRYLL
ncbi:hypothetical protein LTR10_018714 [Elasticomyces elasticus]|uniref:Uncharacterized protein n=1 Tax=Exophiala sideris TaxID=1016849 RepID=A0ABR0JA77_9EURO|nr:hypothetical protein LTR10_018714 [Elasticomyces elasticus]KAK5026249.1 hypothetical protein LTS07_007774 [Exophiala sideris]KAK5032502.1 hypothetical protein LTR13_007325 [Exophiala sideris]KAK5059661.1 hypothetical protein LTR69_006250 [Exophiala sideris]KAK5178055.1 hypothetical protein LTR44_009361 [Eurotiomycetes sp. CCFEE 6388]